MVAGSGRSSGFLGAEARLPVLAELRLAERVTLGSGRLWANGGRGSCNGGGVGGAGAEFSEELVLR